jgi:DNA-binding MarR family transcriptional regulator
VERSLVRLASEDIRRRGYERLTALAGLDLPTGSSWILTRLAKQGAVPGEELARPANVRLDYGRPFVDRLVCEGMVIRSDGTLVLTDAGRQAAEKLFAARRQGLRDLLADWSPEEHAELGDLLTRLSRAMLGEQTDRYLVREPAASLSPEILRLPFLPGSYQSELGIHGETREKRAQYPASDRLEPYASDGHNRLGWGGFI